MVIIFHEKENTVENMKSNKYLNINQVRSGSSINFVLNLWKEDSKSYKTSSLHHELCVNVETAPDKHVPDQSRPSLIDKCTNNEKCWQIAYGFG